MAEPITYAKIASGALKLAQSVSGDNQSSEVIGGAAYKVLIGTLVALLFLICAFVQILTTPLSMLDNLGREFKEKYKSSIIPDVVQYEQIGIYPLPGNSSEVSSYFGSRVHPVTGKQDNHTGIDFRTSWHSPLAAIADGKVVKTGVHKNYGRYVQIRHEEFDTFYAHLSKVYVVRGQEVVQGSVIGYEGGDPELDSLPGTSTGHHLHFEIRKGLFKKPVDPYEYILEPPEEDEEEQEEPLKKEEKK